MKKYLNVYFGDSRTYFCMTETTAKGVELKYVKSLKLIPDFGDGVFSDAGFQYDLSEVTSEIVEDIEGIIPVIPFNQIFTSLMPSPKNLTTEELRKLFKLELRQNFPDRAYEDFSAYCVALKMRTDGENYILGLFIKNKVEEICKGFLSPFNSTVFEIVLPQIATVSAYYLNYPENADKLTVLILLGFNSSSLTICKGKDILYYSEINFENHLQVIENLQREMEKTRDLIKGNYDNLILHGEALTPMILEEYKKVFSNKFPFIGRLNAFRMLTTRLGNEYREYCNRMAHVYPACIGGGMKENSGIIKVI
jgi:hypothetical protein